jgi:zinc transporter ZupT
MIFSLPPIINIVLLSLVAGLGTGLGGLLAIIRKPGRRSFGFLMGMAAGVMISLSFMELVNEAWELAGMWVATLGFSAGSVFMLALDYFLPHIRFGERETRNGGPKRLEETLVEPNPDWQVSQPEAIPVVSSQVLAPEHIPPLWLPHGLRWRGGRHAGQPEAAGRHEIGGWRGRLRQNPIQDRKLLRTGLLLALGITVHNLPEGFAVGAGFMHQPNFGFFIALAILLHNIPEGIATALPLCKSGVCRWDSFRVALFSGLAEPVGALIAALLLDVFTNLVPAALAFAGGVMVFITLDELIPVAREYGHQHFTAIGIILGAVFVFLLSGLFGV